ncbi:transcriptional antiterminator-like protein [Paenibacillus larvae subsp. larvae]|jgi:ascorbate PTS system EIIA or EIIAB component|uniref:Ascorbate-specific PTS system EIIA component n=1 Tax=Paenibacillus larvae subsp. larvae TaxID=147375 RepID=A0A2L1UDI1_9BACL|nr:PTS sugar transporter subunit IIA [Paenibacillus larvae]AQT86518.1 PTS ascorbate transporter subunit IIA [Paenibacillus larvae subsp. pulvifaciens]AQZ48180.1 PTS ascorbate transporter subunit IIA [Paenibacillus larvae subsp. pulvifaciens]AVF26140.1 transcriptional antiterminator-like protein [Paenibacillus larvae subsp. larvae]AVF30918.1 transcriptional antiterminator-like protein [Paenibacillus larvae subsp. larvae]MBH0343978.1 PTS system ascorbate-specific transporter subunit IIA [Paeniba
MLDLKQSLIENDSVVLNESAETWQEAIAKATEPLIRSGAVEPKYTQAIIDSTEHHGPYYILTPGMAMPHARPKDGVNRDAFSLVTLKKPVVFSDGKEVQVLVTLAATSPSIHSSIAIPQIVALFDVPDILERLVAATSVDDILLMVDQADTSTYLK